MPRAGPHPARHRHHELPHSAQRVIKANDNRTIAVFTPLAHAHRPFTAHKAMGSRAFNSRSSGQQG